MILHRVSASIAFAGAALGLLTNSAFAIGLGRASQRAVLGETLSISVPIRLDGGEALGSECVAADVFFGDDKLSPASVSVTLDFAGAEPVLRIQSTVAVNEPVVTLYAVVGCQAKVSRKFVAFADPPSSAARSTAVAALPETSMSGGSPAERDGARQVAQAPVKKRTKVPPDDKGVSRREPVSPAAGLMAQGAPSARLSADRAPGGDRVSPRGRAKVTPRLMLDPAETEAMTVPDLQLALSVSLLTETPELLQRRAAAAALWAAMNASPEQRERDRQRLLELQQRLGGLQQQVAQLTAKSTRLAAEPVTLKRLIHEPLVQGLAAAVLALAGLSGWIWRRSRSAPVGAPWWASAAASQAGETDLAGEWARRLAMPTPAPTPMPQEDSRPLSEPPRPSVDAVAPAPVGGSVPDRAHAIRPEMQPSALASVGSPRPEPLQAPTVPVSGSAFSPLEAVREISVEELIDLEQQAEFFVVLGQDEAAVELLESHLQSAVAVSPLPYLKLLETYRRLDRRPDYERTRESFNARFNAYAPPWDVDPGQGHSLEDYQEVMSRLETLWSVPHRAMDVIDASLTRAEESHETFDLPAYRELLFLYAVARDLADREHEVREPVDLSLSSDGWSTELESAGASTKPEPLMATRPVRAMPEAGPLLIVDLALDEPVAPEAVPSVDEIDHLGNGIEFESVDFLKKDA